MFKKLSISFLLLAAISLYVFPPNKTGLAHPKTSFVIDVLAPAGMPIVSFFHKMRQNSFLNTEHKNATGLEKIGNLLLSPNRFLFGGVEFDDDGSIYNSFQYEKKFSVQLFTSVIYLIPCQILGSICKGLSLLTEPGWAHYQQILFVSKAKTVKSNIHFYAKKGLKRIYSNEFASCQNFQREYGISEKFKGELQALKEVVQLLDKHQIPYWLDCGSCLGAYRHGGVIPWDCDIDIAIIINDHQNVWNALKNLDPQKYELQDWSSYRHPRSFMKLFVKETRSLIDFYHYQIHEEKKTIQYFFSYNDAFIPESWKVYERIMLTPHGYSTIFPLKKAKFEDFTVWVPNKIETFLKNIYGENLNPTMVWDESTKRYQKVLDHPYWDKKILENKVY